MRPTTGVRYVVERAGDSAEGEIVYRGFVHTTDADLALEVRIDRASGKTHAKLDTGPQTAPAIAGQPVDLEATAKALVRAATRSALADGTALPRKIVRWRG